MFHFCKQSFRDQLTHFFFAVVDCLVGIQFWIYCLEAMRRGAGSWFKKWGMGAIKKGKRLLLHLLQSHLGYNTTIPKVKQQEIDRVKAADWFSWDNLQSQGDHFYDSWSARRYPTQCHPRFVHTCSEIKDVERSNHHFLQSHARGLFQVRSFEQLDRQTFEKSHFTRSNTRKTLMKDCSLNWQIWLSPRVAESLSRSSRRCHVQTELNGRTVTDKNLRVEGWAECFFPTPVPKPPGGSGDPPTPPIPFQDILQFCRQKSSVWRQNSNM